MELPRSPFLIPAATQHAVPCLGPRRNPHGSTCHAEPPPDERGRVTGIDAARRSASRLLNAPCHQLPSNLSFMKVCAPWPLPASPRLLKPTSPVGTPLAPHRVGGGMCAPHSPLLRHPLRASSYQTPAPPRGRPSDPSLPWLSTFFPPISWSLPLLHERLQAAGSLEVVITPDRFSVRFMTQNRSGPTLSSQFICHPRSSNSLGPRAHQPTPFSGHLPLPFPLF